MKQKSNGGISEFRARRTGTNTSNEDSPSNKPIRRHRAPLEDAFNTSDSEVIWLVDQNGERVDPEFVKSILDRFTSISGEHPNVQVNPAGWTLISAWHEIWDAISDPISSWQPGGLICVNAQGELLLRLMETLEVITSIAHERALDALKANIDCWLKAMAKAAGVDTLTISITPGPAQGFSTIDPPVQ